MQQREHVQQDGDSLWTNALRKGDERAFTDLFHAHYSGLLGYAGRILRDSEMANDVVQETFCRLYEHREQITIALSLKAYLYKSVYHACLDAIKHRRVEHAYIQRELMDFYLSRVAQTPEAEMLLHDEAIREELRKSVDRLPERCREVFLLSRQEGLSNKQVAERMSISEKTVEAQMSKAIARLKQDLEWLLLIVLWQAWGGPGS
jgi:RNA polymerase sigma-70 factor (ECF subfamily)